MVLIYGAWPSGRVYKNKYNFHKLLGLGPKRKHFHTLLKYFFYLQNPKYGNYKLFYFHQFWQVPPALGWIAVISWSFMLTVGPNMGTTKNKQNRLSFLLNIFNTRNYILNRILDGHFRGDTKQEKLLSFLWITRDSSLIQLIWRKVRTN